MQIHRDDVITASSLEHVRHQFRCNGRAGLVLLVLAGVGEIGDYGCDAPGRSGLAGVDHDEEFHEAVVDVVGAGRLQDEY